MSLDRFIQDFVAQQRSLAENLRSFALLEAAGTIERVAANLEESFQRYWLESIPVSVAAEESGYTSGHIRQLIRDGAIASSGDQANLQVRRADLPRKSNAQGKAAPGSSEHIDHLGKRLHIPPANSALAPRR